MREIFAPYKGKFVRVGKVEDGVFFRTCKSSELYRAMGGSLGVDDSVLAQLKTESVETLRVKIKDEKNVYEISLSKFVSLAKSRNFYGTKRWHLPFVGYWENRDKSTTQANTVKAECPRFQQETLFGGQVAHDRQIAQRFMV